MLTHTTHILPLGILIGVSKFKPCILSPCRAETLNYERFQTNVTPTLKQKLCANKLACTADITTDLQISKAKVLRSLRNCFAMDRPEYNTTDHLKERGMGVPPFNYQEKSVLNQTSIDTVSKATLGRLHFQALHCHLEW